MTAFANRATALATAFLRDEKGVTTIEYGVVATFLSVVIVGGIDHVYSAIEWLFADNESKLNVALAQ